MNVPLGYKKRFGLPETWEDMETQPYDASLKSSNFCNPLFYVGS